MVRGLKLHCSTKPTESVVLSQMKNVNGVSLSGIHHTLLSTALSITSPTPSYFLMLSPTHFFIYPQTNPTWHPCSFAYAVLRSTCVVLSEMPDSSLRLSVALMSLLSKSSFPLMRTVAVSLRFWLFACTLIYPSAWAEVDLRMCSAFSSSLNSCLEV